MTRFLAVGAMALLLWGCGPGATHEDRGTIIGAVAGGVIGNQFGSGKGRVLATAAGVVAGGIIGNAIGRDLDEEERQAALDAEYRALEYGDDEPVEWRSGRRGRRGYVRPGRRYRHEGRQCREYEHTVYIDGEPETLTGRACRRRDGTWENVG